MNTIIYITIKYRAFVIFSLIAMWVVPLQSSPSRAQTIDLPPKTTTLYTEPTTHKYDLYDWTPKDKSAEVLCLSKNIYFEGRGESLRGQIAIGLVTINRVRDNIFPTTICGVVFERGVDRNTKKMVAQFSWTLDGKSNIPNTNSAIWGRILLLAQAMTADGTLDNFKDITNGATHYHAKYIDPNWTNLAFTVNVDAHRFYHAR